MINSDRPMSFKGYENMYVLLTQMYANPHQLRKAIKGLGQCLSAFGMPLTEDHELNKKVCDLALNVFNHETIKTMLSHGFQIYISLQRLYNPF